MTYFSEERGLDIFIVAVDGIVPGVGERIGVDARLQHPLQVALKLRAVWLLNQCQVTHDLPARKIPSVITLLNVDHRIMAYKGLHRTSLPKISWAKMLYHTLHSLGFIGLTGMRP